MFTKNCREAIRAMSIGRRKYSLCILHSSLNTPSRISPIYLRKNSITISAYLWDISSEDGVSVRARISMEILCAF